MGHGRRQGQPLPGNDGCVRREVCALESDGESGCGVRPLQTSVQVAQKAFPTSAPVVFVATGTGFADALSAAAPAAELGGPLLLTAPGFLPATVKAEIQSLHPKTIYIVGGTGAISATVEQQLQPLAATVTRLAGSDRFDTARQVIGVAFKTMTKVYVATGMNFPDALSASAAAGAAGLPVLLVNGAAPALDSTTTDFLTAHGANAFTVIGGPGVVSAGIATQLGASRARSTASTVLTVTRPRN